MATYTTKKCPHCGYIINTLETGINRQYGCPYKLCPKCFKRYWDTSVLEPALYEYEAETTKTNVTISAYIIIGIMIQIGAVSLLPQGIILEALIAIAFGAVLEIVSAVEIHQRSKHAEEILKKQREEYDESKERLQDTEYLTALADYDKRAKELLRERQNGEEEHYACRP